MQLVDYIISRILCKTIVTSSFAIIVCCKTVPLDYYAFLTSTAHRLLIFHFYPITGPTVIQNGIILLTSLRIRIAMTFTNIAPVIIFDNIG